MRVWIVHSTTEHGSQLEGVFLDLPSALKQMSTDLHTACELEVGKDYRDITRFLIVTKARPIPRMIDLGAVPRGGRPTFLTNVETVR